MAIVVPIRVLHAVVNMNRGGAETLIMNIYRNIDRSLVQFDFLTSKKGVYDEEIVSLGGNIHRIPYISEVGPYRYIIELDNFFSTHQQYKIVHSHMDKMSGLVLRAAKKANIPVRIAHSHSTKNEGNILVKIFKWYAGRNILPNATDLFACSNVAANWLFQSQSSKAIIIKNGIEIAKFRYFPNLRKEVRDELNVPPETIVLGHVGRFSQAKNHSFLLELFAEVNKISPNFLLVLVGDGPLKGEIEKKVKSLNLTNKVIFLGSRSDVYRIYNAFDILVFPSLHEGLPVTLVEAQVNGLPCLISDVITKEVDMGLGLIKHLPLNQKEVWINAILKQNDHTRDINTDLIVEQGYDIKNTTEQIMRYYLNLSKSIY